MKTYSLFILKPGFVDKFDELKAILAQNEIKIEKFKEGVLPLDKVEVHYEEHKGKSFYDGLVRYMTQGDVKGIYKFDPNTITMLVSSLKDESEEDFITRTRALVKEVIRPKFALKREAFKALSDEDFEELTKTANVLHASDSPVSAEREIKNLL